MAEIIEVSKTEEGTRLFRWLFRRYPSLLQRDFHRLCRGGQIRINSSRCRGNEFLCAGDKVRIPPTMTSYLKQQNTTETGEHFSLSDLEDLRKCILYNDDDIVVFNKPSGLAVQGGTGIKKSLDKMASAMFPYDKISLVHRLDKETSGLLVVAKNQKSAQFLSEAFQNKTAFKEYLALLNGPVSPSYGIIDNYIAKDMVYEESIRINDGTGQKTQRAITEYRVLTCVGDILSWILFCPKTGRNHQLRIHSAKCLNAPIVGDELFCGKKIGENLEALLNKNKLFLFAYKITFKHPSTGKVISLCATELPDFMSKVVKMLELPLP